MTYVTEEENFRYTQNFATLSKNFSFKFYQNPSKTNPKRQEEEMHHDTDSHIMMAENGVMV
jgi:hypothetical protein